MEDAAEEEGGMNGGVGGRVRGWAWSWELPGDVGLVGDEFGDSVVHAVCPPSAHIFGDGAGNARGNPAMSAIWRTGAGIGGGISTQSSDFRSQISDLKSQISMPGVQGPDFRFATHCCNWFRIFIGCAAKMAGRSQAWP